MWVRLLVVSVFLCGVCQVTADNEIARYNGVLSAERPRRCFLLRADDIRVDRNFTVSLSYISGAAPIHMFVKKGELCPTEAINDMVSPLLLGPGQLSTLSVNTLDMQVLTAPPPRNQTWFDRVKDFSQASFTPSAIVSASWRFTVSAPLPPSGQFLPVSYEIVVVSIDS
eukprot:GILJ01001810.1.p1 GENE.GILJ01001810.1~~GILJ01001810.1.p1  ORF type:complete len:169 (-),score=21.28 GILJ01001810.1:422-928(-)